MWISFYWHSVQYVTEIEEVDSALLTDDLPLTLSWITTSLNGLDDSSED
jgi:hypothetical protein